MDNDSEVNRGKSSVSTDANRDQTSVTLRCRSKCVRLGSGHNDWIGK